MVCPLAALIADGAHLSSTQVALIFKFRVAAAMIRREAPVTRAKFDNLKRVRSSRIITVQ